MSQSSSRKDGPPKRQKPGNPRQSDASLPSSKRLKNNDKTSIPQRTTEKEIEDFKSKTTDILFETLELSPSRIIVRPFSLLFSDGLFTAISHHLFPLISQKRHYLQTLKYIDLQLSFRRFDKNHVNFINDLFAVFSSLPSLRLLRFELYHHITHEIAEELDLLKL